MKAIKVLFFSLIIFNFNLNAQQVRETRMSVLDADRMAHSLEFNFEEKIIKDAWDKKVKEMKLKSKNEKGLEKYESITFPDIHFENIDLYVKIEKLDKTRSSITLTVSKGYGNFISSEDSKIVDNVKSFLTNFIEYVNQYKLKLDIADQEKLIEKSTKEQEKLIEDGKKLTEELDKNKIAQENKVKELEAQKKALEELKSKVK